MTVLYDALRAILEGYAIEEIALTMPDGDPSEVIIGDDGEMWSVQAGGERLVLIIQLVKQPTE